MDTRSTVHRITDTIPHDEICAAFDVKTRSIRLARENGFFPASWYVGMKDLCEKHGLACPDSVFNFKRGPSLTTTAAIKRGKPAVEDQGAAS